MAKSRKRNRGINPRKARAGLEILNGKPVGKALTESGYSPKTARNPKRNNLSVEQCLAETAKLPGMPEPVTLLRKARTALDMRLSQLIADPDSLAAERLADIARTAESAEKYYSGSAHGKTDERLLPDRIAFVQVLIQSLPAGSLPHSVVNRSVDNRETAKTIDVDATHGESDKSPR